jgi:hypothetical protein
VIKHTPTWREEKRKAFRPIDENESIGSWYSTGRVRNLLSFSPQISKTVLSIFNFKKIIFLSQTSSIIDHHPNPNPNININNNNNGNS